MIFLWEIYAVHYATGTGFRDDIIAFGDLGRKMSNYFYGLEMEYAVSRSEQVIARKALPK